MSNKKRRILVVTGSRGEYGYIRPILKLMRRSRTLQAEVVATNMHLLPEFGDSVREFHKDRFEIAHKVYMALDGYTTTTMVKSLGVFLLSAADILSNRRPDIILIAGDRGEQLMAAIAGAHMNIPVAHIQAGEVSGNVDGLSRNAIARFTHIHLVSNEDAKKRLLRMGEEAFRIFEVGAPQLDEFVQNRVAPAKDVASKFSLDLKKPVIMLVQHPVTEQAAEAADQMAATMQAVLSFKAQTVIIYPNNDAGSVAIQECIHQHRDASVRVERNVTREMYAGLMKVASVLVGNSSSGILEAPSFELPAVNIGRRQKGRFQGANVINVNRHDPEPIKAAIRKGLSKGFRKGLRGMPNPYGDGRSSERILKILESIPIDEKLIFKGIVY